MPTYILLGTFTDQGIRAVKDTTKRVDAVRALAKKLGATVKEVYWTQGTFDTALIVDAPDGSAVMALGLSIGALGQRPDDNPAGVHGRRDRPPPRPAGVGRAAE